ncbi:MAG TPA: glutamate--tRNA ligase [Sulfuricaulis sp.]|nr:glutamate--tRNA ligase [Sulfuricaulis sp.]
MAPCTMTSRPIKTRFTPRPTGLLHLGNIRTALFNFLLARQAQGLFLLRLEDTDAMRGHEKYTRALELDLRWLGLTWDEGPQVGGRHGPYAQSERGPLYKEYFSSLESRGLAYPCFCSEHELAIARKTALATGRPPRYSGKCHALSAKDVQARFSRGEPATLRFRVEEGKTVEFEDKVRGPQAFRTDDIGDYVIRRSDGTPAFFFCNAIDDALMGVTLVVRGEDHLTNTPRQILLLESLGLPIPDYAHIALVVGADGAPLSKRTGSKSIEDLRTAGFLPLAINNYLARLGHTFEVNTLMNLELLATNFNLSRLGRAPARYDEDQLVYWQKEAIRFSSNEELWEWMNSKTILNSRVGNFVPKGKEFQFTNVIRENISNPDDAFIWAGNLFATSNRYDHNAKSAITKVGTDFYKYALECLDEDPTNFQAYVKRLEISTNKKGKSLFMPLRAALTGEVNELISQSGRTYEWNHGPQLEAVWGLLGMDLIRRRLNEAMTLTKTEGSY